MQHCRIWPFAVMVESERETQGGKKSVERRCFLSFLPQDAERIGQKIQAHWEVENRLKSEMDVIEASLGTQNMEKTLLKHVGRQRAEA
jgi:predicted transposase YbfD/YdcC